MQKACNYALFYIALSAVPVSSVEVQDKCLEKVVGWVRANEVKLNSDKTEMLVVNGKIAQKMTIQPVLEGVALPLKEPIHSLIPASY